MRIFEEIKLGQPFELLGRECVEQADGMHYTQKSYIKEKCLPISTAAYTPRELQKIPDGHPVYKAFRNRLGSLLWVTKTRPEIEFDLSILASMLAALTLSTIQYINSVISQLLNTVDQEYFVPRLPPGEIVIQGIGDASLGGRPDESSQGSRVVGLMSVEETSSGIPSSGMRFISSKTSNSELSSNNQYKLNSYSSFAPIEYKSSKVRRKGVSSFDVETLVLVDLADIAYVIGLLLEELLWGKRPTLAQRRLMQLDGVEVEERHAPIILDTDAKDCVDRVYSLQRSLDISKRRRMDIDDLQDLLQHKDLQLIRHIHGPTNPMNFGTKKRSRTCADGVKFMSLFYDGLYIPDLTAKNRKPVRGVKVCQCMYCQQSTSKLQIFTVT